MPRAPRPAYYAVRVGRVPGIYLSWADCEIQVKGYTGALYKKLNTEAEAIEFMAIKPNIARTSASRDMAPIACSSRVAIVPGTSAPRHTDPTPEDEKDCDIVYCDGACRRNGQAGSVAGIGVWWGHGDPRNISDRCPGDQTNNRAELIAIVRTLETAPRLKRRLLIKTDSYYSIQCVSSWIFKWMKNGFLAADGKPVKNRAVIKYLAALLHMRRKTSQTVEFKHVRGHTGIEGNEAADQLANLGAAKPVVPERNWEQLEEEVLQSLGPAKPAPVPYNDPKAYANGLWNDDRLAELADASISSVVVPRGRHPVHEGNVTPSRTSVAVLVPHQVLPSRQSAVELAAVRPSSGNRPATVMSKDDLEAFASSLLGDEELSALGKDFDF